MIYIFDGAMGTMLQNAGLKPGECPELLNVEQPELVTKVHAAYIAHGADIIETNSFGANRIKLSHYGLSDRVTELNTAAVMAAKAAAKGNVKIAGSVGSTGKFIKPLGELSFDEVYDVFVEQISALVDAGADMILIETIIDIQEMRAALLAAKSVTNKPVICQLSFDNDGRTVTGTDPKTAAITLEAMGADIIGANCSLGPAQLLPIVEIFAANCDCPISIQPNAGMPHLVEGKTVFPMEAEEMGTWAPKLIAAGATYIGGCCGTTPQHIAAIKRAVQGLSPAVRKNRKPMLTLSSRSKTVCIDKSLPTVLLGERINPTGRKKLAAEIKEGIFLSVKKEALEQVHAGAHLLDVNMGVAGIDQEKAMEKAITEIAQLVDVPLVIDTSDAKALEAGLKAYPGRALINSVSAEPDRLRDFLPLAKKYGAAILCLPISASGVPKTAPERVAVIQTILDHAQSIGLKAGDFLLDALVMTIAADDEACIQTLNTLQLYREKFGYPSTMGLSNISFGLPNRPCINSHFFTMCLAHGLDAPIMNPYDQTMQDALLASSALLGHDKNAHHYSKIAAKITAAPLKTAETLNTETNILLRMKQAVLNGEKEAIALMVEKAIAEGHSSAEITDKSLTAAMNDLGIDFGSGKVFLPQVLLSAETMREAFLKIKELLPTQNLQNKGTVVIATVKGDIHDLGKNIVGALLENNGFHIIDLGKDVDLEKIVKTAIESNADIIGLCALMTTTMPQIDLAIQALKDVGSKAKIMVGGAVLTQEYADQAGADCYARDGVVAVNLAKKLVEK
ncbi:homocysteine S-methyltransferase family protein [Massilibacillus massiliensis]|nr:homocysteine S-methyltransferase family protein [Massilibacillus massiliensis]